MLTHSGRLVQCANPCSWNAPTIPWIREAEAVLRRSLWKASKVKHSHFVAKKTTSSSLERVQAW
ncbi:hypothetical protein BDN72DRAFT_76435 [Pluteus cervinus]|uniref:Uncharacterized protein n=1 Tax=Pluteus cervinus TaxID=181527 RepID=A0ACD3AQK7_9AGAR|nr:hypothetical protein BDN72DRAFT_76435 [Pluteus cervinus]